MNDSPFMRIAISGSHRVGKTALAEALATRLPDHQLLPEPYFQLEEEGHLFASPPSIDDFEVQLERSIRSILESDTSTIFDRCPLDLLGYALVHSEAERFDADLWMDPIRESVSRLDRLFFVPVETPDRVAVLPEECDMRSDVDDALRGIVLDDEMALELEAVELTGSVEEWLRRALTAIEAR